MTALHILHGSRTSQNSNQHTKIRRDRYLLLRQGHSFTPRPRECCSIPSLQHQTKQGFFSCLFELPPLHHRTNGSIRSIGSQCVFAARIPRRSIASTLALTHARSAMSHQWHSWTSSIHRSTKPCVRFQQTSRSDAVGSQYDWYRYRYWYYGPTFGVSGTFASGHSLSSRTVRCVHGQC